ncbi:MAG: glycosyltransferase [Acetobacteraceae bacterium]|nr:glycosyltransferase [Acetobacteraceae bacterium]
MRLALLVPGSIDAVSGGYAYDRRMVSGLRATGHDVRVVELAGQYPLADDTARGAVGAAWTGLATDEMPIIDGLALPAFSAAALAARASVGLIHHPTALETGFAEDVRECLREIERQLMPLLARVIVTSQPTAERLVAEFGVRTDRIAVVVPGTEDAPRCRGAMDGVCRLLSIGTLIPRKGHDQLLRALARLTDMAWQLTIVGSAARDPLHALGLAALAGELGIASRVHFAGEVVDNGLETLWREANIFALATQYEGYGMVIADALKRGIPVAVTAGGAAGSLVPAEAGVVCPVGDVDQLSKALRRMIFGRELRDYLAENAWQAGQALPSWNDQARAFAVALT